jgi:hypothetical protein
MRCKMSCQSKAWACRAGALAKAGAMKMVPTPMSAFAKPVAAVYDRRSVRGLNIRSTANSHSMAFGISTLCPLCLRLPTDLSAIAQRATAEGFSSEQPAGFVAPRSKTHEGYSLSPRPMIGAIRHPALCSKTAPLGIFRQTLMLE